MSEFDLFKFDGKRVLVVGGATGMGAAAARLALDAGAEVLVMDYAEVEIDGVVGSHVNLSDVSSIDAAVAELPDSLHAVLACAGVADGPGIEKINFLGHRYLIEQLRASRRLGRGSAVAFISSAAGLAWEASFETLSEFLDITDVDAASEWVLARGNDNYMFTKQAVCAYVAREAMSFLQDGIRLNAICPGPTDTPLAQANRDLWLDFGSDFREAVGVAPSTPAEQAAPLLFLCSPAAASINGITMITDAGYISAGLTGAFPPAESMAKFLTGR